MGTIARVDVGVDVSKKHLDVFLHQVEKHFRVENTPQGIVELANELAKYNIGQIACEATEGYESLLVKSLRRLKFRVWRVSPSRIRAFIKSQGKRAKTDKIDAKMIAWFAAVMINENQMIDPTEQQEKIRNLVALKMTLTTEAAEAKTRLQQTTDKDVIKLLTSKLSFAQKQIKALTKKINVLVKSEPDLKKIEGIIRSIPGIGEGTASAVQALFIEIGQITNKQAAALIGVAPMIMQSGDHKGYSHIYGGRSPLRGFLYMASLNAIKFNPVLKEFYERLIARGKPFKVAIVAVMRKLVIYMNTLVRKGELWNPAI
jgi:transposase